MKNEMRRLKKTGAARIWSIMQMRPTFGATRSHWGPQQSAQPPDWLCSSQTLLSNGSCQPKTRSSLKHDPWCLWHVFGWRRILASKETRGLADREVGRGQLFPFCSNATLYFPILRALLSLIELSPLFLGWALLGGFGRLQTDCFIVRYVANPPPNH